MCSFKNTSACTTILAQRPAIHLPRGCVREASPHDRRPSLATRLKHDMELTPSPLATIGHCWMLSHLIIVLVTLHVKQHHRLPLLATGSSLTASTELSAPAFPDRFVHCVHLLDKSLGIEGRRVGTPQLTCAMRQFQGALLPVRHRSRSWMSCGRSSGMVGQTQRISCRCEVAPRQEGA
jgi:hypothetical protein